MGRKKNTDIEKEQPCRKTKTIKVLHSCSRMELPKISMEGKWLEELGFQIGDRLQVKYGNQYICISHAADIHQPLAVHEQDTAYGAGMADSENLRIYADQVFLIIHLNPVSSKKTCLFQPFSLHADPGMFWIIEPLSPSCHFLSGMHRSCNFNMLCFQSFPY